MNTPRGWRLGLGPVFTYEWIVSSRRWQAYALRSLFAGALLAALVVVWTKSSVTNSSTSLRGLAELGQSFYVGVIGTQLTLVLLAAPAATAGAICSDRAAGTMTHVLVTDLSDFEIVLGKLAARLIPVAGLTACALPLMAILTLLGGVDPHALVGAFFVTAGIALVGCTLALFFSLWSQKTHEALLATYAVYGVWLLGRPFVGMFNSTFGTTLNTPAAIADPFHLALAPYLAPGTVTARDYLWFLCVATTVSTALVFLCIARLRAVCTRVNAAEPRTRRRRFQFAILRLDVTRYLPAPPLDFNPVLWREWHRTRPTRWARVVTALFFAGASIASVCAIVMPRGTFAMAWVNGLQVSIGMLLLSVTAATSLAEERMRGSLDVLMTTTLSTRDIVLGKWMGTYRTVPLLAVLPVLVSLCNDVSRRAYLPTAIMTLLFVFTCGAAITSLGLAMATWCARLGRAIALTISLYVLITVGWLFLGIWFRGGHDTDGLMMASPFFFAGELAADLCSPGMARDHIGWAIVWTSGYAIAAALLLIFTLVTFDRCLGRVNDASACLPSERLTSPTKRNRAGLTKDSSDAA